MRSTTGKSLIIALLAALVIAGCSSDEPTNSNGGADDDDYVILRSSSEHFRYYCTLRDTQVIDTISQLLESNLARVCALYSFSIDDTIDVRIYPDFETFHNSVEWPTEDVPATLVGQCVDANEIKIISPLSAEPINSYGEILLVAVHESMHAFHFHIYENTSGVAYPPQWLFEGFASFEANILPNPDIIRQSITDNDLPLIEQYEDSDFFVENYGYHFCYTIFEFLVSEYGYQKVSTLLRYPTLIAYALGADITIETLNAGWHEFLIENYS